MSYPVAIRRGALTALLLAAVVLPLHGKEKDPIPELIRVAAGAKDFKQRLSAVLGLARSRDPRAVEPLLRAMKDAHHTVRGAAAGALGALSDARARAALEAALLGDPDDYVRAQAQKALAGLMAAEEGKAPSGDGKSMELLGSLGTIDQLAIKRGLRAPTAKALVCLGERLEAEPYLGGTLSLKFRVAQDGAVRWVKLMESDLGHLGVERCIMAVMAAATFEAPSGGEAEFSLPLALGGGDKVTLLEAATSTAATGLARKCATLLRTDRRQVKLSPPPGLRVTLYLDAAGVVRSAGLSAGGAEIPAAFADRFLANLRAMTLKDEALQEGTNGKLVLPFVCEPKKAGQRGKSRRKPRKRKKG